MSKPQGKCLTCGRDIIGEYVTKPKSYCNRSCYTKKSYAKDPEKHISKSLAYYHTNKEALRPIRRQRNRLYYAKRALALQILRGQGIKI